MEPKPSTELADCLGDIEDFIRLLEGERDRVRAELAAAILAEGGDLAISSTGKTYKLARPAARYTFNVPPAELERLGILSECTPPPAPPKLTKTKLDDLLKRRLLDDDAVAEWMHQGYYVIERSDEITVKQVETKLETLQKAMGL